MSVNPYNKSRYGYTGLFRQPYANQGTHGDTLYAITDEKCQECHLLVLSDGFFKDAYQFASQPTYQAVHIYVPSIGVLFISDLFRLVTTLKKIKRNVFWHFPVKYKTDDPVNVLFEMAQSQKMTTMGQVDSLMQLSISFVQSSVSDSWYDFKVVNGKNVDYFSLAMTEVKLNEILATKTADRVHLPYNTYYLDSISAKDVACHMPGDTRYIVPNNFRLGQEFVESMSCGFALIDRLLG